jgi:hypothetical protein
MWSPRDGPVRGVDLLPRSPCGARRTRNSQDLWIGVSRDLLITTL